MATPDSWPPALVNALRVGNVVPFIGAGLSIPSGLPSWQELLAAAIAEAADECALPHLRTLFESGEIASLDAPQLHQALLGSRFRLIDFVLARLSQPAQPNSYHRLLGQLRLDTILTTNYDRLIERYFEGRGDAVHSLWLESHIAQYNERDALQVVKMHGHIDDPRSIVLSRDDYERYAPNHRLLYSLVSVLFSTRTVLFLGCSLTDPNIVTLLEELKRRTGGFSRDHYILLYQPAPTETRSLRSLGLQVIGCSAATRDLALESWLQGLVTRSRVVATTNAGKSRMINDGLKAETPVALPGALIRMRAAMGIISNPRAIPAGLTVYGDASQDALEIEMGNLARSFLAKHPQNRIRTIVHVNPRIQLRKGFSRPALRARLEAMAEFLTTFGSQIELAQAEMPVTTNHVIIGDKRSFLAFKQGGDGIGYKATRMTSNRWTIRSEIEAFDSDFGEVASRNRTLASELGIDTTATAWSTTFAQTVVSAALETLDDKGTVLECDEQGSVLRSVDRAFAHHAGVRHCSVHLCLFATRAGRAQVLLQRRAAHKDLYPGMICVAVTGHPESPDNLREVLRECSEELGLWLDPADVNLCGMFPRQAETDVEVVTLFRADLSERVAFAPRNVSDDVDALYWVDLENILANPPRGAAAFVRNGSVWRSYNCVLTDAEMLPGTIDEVVLASGNATTRH